jgi:sugar/nucleoside kinase (ribokinase family)
MSTRELEDVRDSVIRKISRAIVNVDVVTMPDFFLDHSVAYARNAVSLAGRIVSVAAKGGGEIPDLPQRLELGGNTAICTLALSKMGARVHPVIKTSSLGLQLLKHFYQGLEVDLSHVKTNSHLTPTIILELGQGGNPANVMLGDWAAVPGFGFDDLQPEDLNLISHANYTCVFNWLYNRKGTELAREVFNFCSEKSASHTFFDPADPWPRRKELPNLIRSIFRNDLLDILAVNENEAVLFARGLGKKTKLYTGRRESEAAGVAAARAISANTNVKVYVHTSEYSALAQGDDRRIVPTFKVTMRRGTGAGDTWNAGILVAESLGLNNGEELLFANAVAANYISRSERVHSTISDISDFLQNCRNRLRNLPNQ